MTMAAILNFYRGGDVIIIIIIIIIRRRNGANTICLPNFVWGT
jgi:hypothetical protein